MFLEISNHLYSSVINSFIASHYLPKPTNEPRGERKKPMTENGTSAPNGHSHQNGSSTLPGSTNTELEVRSQEKAPSDQCFLYQLLDSSQVSQICFFNILVYLFVWFL
jgi:hypothetical protein